MSWGGDRWARGAGLHGSGAVGSQSHHFGSTSFLTQTSKLNWLGDPASPQPVRSYLREAAPPPTGSLVHFQTANSTNNPSVPTHVKQTFLFL